MSPSAQTPVEYHSFYGDPRNRQVSGATAGEQRTSQTVSHVVHSIRLWLAEIRGEGSRDFLLIRLI